MRRSACSYIWGMENTAWLQWGANMNSVMERNIGQSLGVGAVFNPDSFATTSRLDNLNKLEHLAYKLTPPAWPAAIFGPIDEAKAARGRGVYERTCANCHEKPFEVSPDGLVTYQLFKLSEVGPARWPHRTSTSSSPSTGRSFGSPPPRSAFSKGSSVSTTSPTTFRSRRRRNGKGAIGRPAPGMRSTLADAEKYPDSKGGRVYPAKPLAGIWATAPYLNNGSVANMWDLLTAPGARPAKFPLGSREYDTEKLGYRRRRRMPRRRRPRGNSIRPALELERRTRVRHEAVGRRQVGAHRVPQGPAAWRHQEGPVRRASAT